MVSVNELNVRVVTQSMLQHYVKSTGMLQHYDNDTVSLCKTVLSVPTAAVVLIVVGGDTTIMLLLFVLCVGYYGMIAAHRSKAGRCR